MLLSVAPQHLNKRKRAAAGHIGRAVPIRLPRAQRAANGVPYAYVLEPMSPAAPGSKGLVYRRLCEPVDETIGGPAR
jgi:hypothetical protein